MELTVPNGIKLFNKHFNFGLDCTGSLMNRCNFFYFDI